MESKGEFIYTLIAAKLCGETLAEDEERSLSAWLETPAHRERYAYYQSLFEARERLRVHDRARLPHDFARRHFRVVPRRARRWARYAAVIVPLLAIAVVTWKSYREETARAPLATLDIAPGGSRAVLRLTDGRQVPLADSGLLVQNGVALLPEADAGTLVYRNAADVPPPPATRHRLEVGRGGEYKVELADGSRVWLNSESTLIYPSHFTGDERRVHLNGEAYFEVARDEARPFIVTVDDCDVRVLGTAFNVTRYTGDRHVVVTLLSGSVEVSADGLDEQLLPGQQCTYDQHERTMTLREVNPARYTSWTNGLFIFDGISIEELARQIARWYDVETRFADETIRSASFTGAMERYKPVSYIIRLLNETNTVTCSLENNRVLTFHAPR
jgi:ferric-dicitrate binding protein FerR (iron transport regulator)